VDYVIVVHGCDLSLYNFTNLYIIFW